MTWISPLTALAAAFAIAWLAARPGLVGEPTTWAIVARAWASVLFAFLAGWLALRWICRCKGPAALMLASAAAWTVPTVLLWRDGSPWTVLPALLLVAQLSAPLHAASGLGPAQAQATAILVSGALQFGLTLIAFDRINWSAILLTTGITLLAGRWITTRPASLSLPRARSALSLAACTLLTLVLLYPPGGYPAISRESLRRRFANAMRVASVSTSPPSPVDPDPGVILFPELTRNVFILPPLPRSLQPQRDPPKEKTLEIPFFGVYWYFPGTDSEPPPNSITRFGSAADFRFRTVNQRTLHMEARQNLGQVIPLSCCRRIDIWVKNAETISPTNVRLELRLANTHTGVERLVDTRPLISHRMPGEPPAHEKLPFVLPGDLMNGFDEFRVRFWLDWRRSHRSAPVAIERFVLVPRGP